MTRVPCRVQKQGPQRRQACPWPPIPGVEFLSPTPALQGEKILEPHGAESTALPLKPWMSILIISTKLHGFLLKRRTAFYFLAVTIFLGLWPPRASSSFTWELVGEPLLRCRVPNQQLPQRPSGLCPSGDAHALETREKPLDLPEVYSLALARTHLGLKGGSASSPLSRSPCLSSVPQRALGGSRTCSLRRL